MDYNKAYMWFLDEHEDAIPLETYHGGDFLEVICMIGGDACRYRIYEDENGGYDIYMK